MELIENIVARTTIVGVLIAALVDDVLNNVGINGAGGRIGHLWKIKVSEKEKEKAFKKSWIN